MVPFTVHTGLAVPLDRSNVDTDQIISKEFLRGTERQGYGRYLLYHWRFGPDSSPVTDFVLNIPGYAGATVLIAGRNFGAGSSREHAVWSLQDYGFRVIIAPSFADIFFNNCFTNGLLPVVLPDPVVRLLMERAAGVPGYQLTVDLVNTVVTDGAGLREAFPVDPSRRHCLLNGLDEIGITLGYTEAIDAFEARRPAYYGA